MPALRIRALRFVLAALSGCALSGCASFGAVYPPRPAAMPGPPSSEPAPSRLVIHVSVTHDGLASQLDAAVPKTGEGEFPLLGAQRHYSWSRDAFDVRFDHGRLVLAVRVTARVGLPLRTVELPLDLTVAAEPVMNRDYMVKLQSVDVKVTSDDRRLELANALGGVFDSLGQKVRVELEHFGYDVRPLVGEAYARVAQPTRFPVGDATGCARIRLLDVEAGPTVLADGLEKDLALVVAPQVTLPCGPDEALPPLPPLSNVAAVPTGPFTVTIPVAASYDELAHAMSAAFTDGKLAFTKDYPGLYLEHPQLYDSQGLVVLELHLHGPVHAMGIDADLDGNLYFSGHLRVADNELSIPDLEPTIETHNFFLSLKAATGGATIRDQARNALRLDLGERLKQVRTTLASQLTFGGKDACFHGDVDKIELASVYAHGTYLRVYVTVTARASATIPCVSGAP